MSEVTTETTQDRGDGSEQLSGLQPSVEGRNVRIERGAAGVIRAESVDVERGGAAFILADDDVHVQQGGARTMVAGESLTITQGGAGMIVAGGDVQIHQGGAGTLVALGGVQVERGGAGIMLTPRATINQGGFVGIVFASSVDFAPGSRVLVAPRDLPRAAGIGAAVVAGAMLLRIVRRLRA